MKPIKISLFDHRLETCWDDRYDLQIQCSCGAEFTEYKEFFRHQRDWLNKQLEEHGIEVV